MLKKLVQKACNECNVQVSCIRNFQTQPINQNTILDTSIGASFWYKFLEQVSPLLVFNVIHCFTELAYLHIQQVPTTLNYCS